MKALIRQQLAAALWANDPANIDPDDLVEALLPIVEGIAKKYAAQVLRSAAMDERDEADNVPDTDQGTHADGHRCAADFLDRRADRLDPHRYDPDTCRCTCGALDHPDWVLPC
ncbi:hypothetical protein [Nocardioides sp.]|uniref:hypothetical protein n=1 Tax=Nocardioides sp. TaxID=35761 RepID=UPI003562504A